jgi:hypothetical protein
MRNVWIFNMLLCAIALVGTGCTGQRKDSPEDRLREVDSLTIARFVDRVFRGPGPGNPNQIPPQENFVVAVEIKDGPCKANGGDIVYVAYRMESGGKYWDCILRAERGRLTKILKINIDNEQTPQEMIQGLLETHCDKGG